MLLPTWLLAELKPAVHKRKKKKKYFFNGSVLVILIPNEPQPTPTSIFRESDGFGDPSSTTLTVHFLCTSQPLISTPIHKILWFCSLGGTWQMVQPFAKCQSGSTYYIIIGWTYHYKTLPSMEFTWFNFLSMRKNLWLDLDDDSDFVTFNS